MKFKILPFALMLVSLSAFAQHQKPTIKEQPYATFQPSAPVEVHLFKEINHDESKTKWMRSLTRLAKYHEQPDSIDVIKAAKELVKAQTRGEVQEQNNQGNSRAVTPILGTNFLGNQIPNATPPDNAMAISNGGRIVSSDNSTIEYYTETGSYVLINESHSDFFNDNSLSGNIFDPRLLYDSQADRFIFVILHGSSPSNSKVLIAFSKTNNPSNGWWTYQITGNPLNNNSWFDYPHIGVSNNDLFITGNLFSSSGSFNGAVLYQMPKAQGYAGQSFSYSTFSNITDGQGVSAGSLVPASYGQQGNYGPGIYLTSARSGGGNRIFLYDVTADYGNNPQLNAYNVPVPSYSPAADAYQVGSAPDLNNNDCRMQHCFYLNGNIHAVNHGDYNNTAYNGINYYRIPLTNLNAAQTANYGSNGTDYSFPSIASFALDSTSSSVMIGYLRVSSSTFPSMEVVNCDQNMTFSSPTVVKEGDTYINYTWTSGVERWGDYSDLQRKHSASSPEVWFAGCFGATSPVNRTWNTWIGEIKGEVEQIPYPVALFTADTFSGYAPLTVNFTDTSLNNPTQRAWTFIGGFPTLDYTVNPTITYNSPGSYDVKLVVANQHGTDTLTKQGYIVVLEDTIPDTPNVVNEINKESLKLYPNPVANYELVHMDIEVFEFSDTEVEVFDIQGRSIKLLLKDRLMPGLHRLSFNSMALSSGTYIVQVRVNNQITKNEKIIVE